MLSGSATVQMQPRSPISNLLELSLKALLLSSSSSLPPPPRTPPPFLHLVLFSSSKPLLYSLSHGILVMNLSGLWRGILSLVRKEKNMTQFWTKSMGNKYGFSFPLTQTVTLEYFAYKLPLDIRQYLASRLVLRSQLWKLSGSPLLLSNVMIV